MNWILLLTSFFQDIPSSENQVDLPISSSYIYLGEGSQLAAFVSEDGKTVLKIFKARHEKSFKIKRYFRSFSAEKKSQSSQKWKQKFADTCRRTELAYSRMPDETGIIALHFTKTPLSLSTTLIDKKGLPHIVALNELPFILQQKAELVPSHLNHLIKEGRIAEAKECVQSLYTLFATKKQKGLTDPRQTLSTNYGFIGNRAIQIDLGKIEEGEKSYPEKIALWIAKNFPTLDASDDAPQHL